MKNLKAFIDRKGICYTPEAEDADYTFDNYLEIALGNKYLARVLFDLSDWQHPETILDELLREGEIIEENNTYKIVAHEQIN